MDEFCELRDLICERTGLYFADKKIFFLKKRLQTCMEQSNFSTPAEYIRYLKFSDLNGREFQRLSNLITTNETYFFREFDQLACFAEDCLPELCELSQNRKQISIWCAACSSGEEAYTLAIILREFLESNWSYHIWANDIDEKALQRARAGVYSDRSVQYVPEEYYHGSFFKTAEGHKVRPSVRENVEFQAMNLVDREQMRTQRNHHAIFCRNALIYFDEHSRRQVVEEFYNALLPGGFIFLGHSESVGRITTKFHLRRFGKNLVYQKPKLS
jgi:chemotaxis protein methyltransferase CheR